MVSKRGLTSFIFLIVFTILLIGTVSSASCSVQSSPCSTATVMKLSSNSNAHGSLWDSGTYGSYLCCDFTGVHTCELDYSNKVLGLSAPTNAHAEIPSYSTYSSSVCFGNLTCTTASGGCPLNRPIQMVSLSNTTNAHLGTFSTYTTNQICCAFYIPGAVCGNSVNETGEICDDGDVIPGDCCSSTCQIETGCTCTGGSGKSICSPICGNGVINTGETCDDGDAVSGDGCNSTCQVESGYTCPNPPGTCCYQTDPPTSWEKNGVAFTGGNIAVGDILKMIISDDLCLPTGTSVTFEIYKGSTLLATTSGSSVQATNSISATYTVTPGFLTSLGTTSDIYFKTLSPSITSTPLISVTPIMCDLTSASWSVTSATAGNIVNLNLAGTNCNGKTITFEVWEYDFWPGTDDTVTTNPPPITFNGVSSSGIWTSEWQDDTDGLQSDPPEYYFIARVQGYSESITSSKTGVNDPLILKVSRAVTCNDGYCDTGETCSSCPQDCGCTTGYECYSGSCALTCVLDSKVWNVSSAVGGQQVQLNVSGTNCNGYSVSFDVYKYRLVLADILVDTNTPSPANVLMSGGQAATRWFAEWPGHGDGDTTPSYYFVPKINALGKELTANTPRLSVTQNLYCGDGIVTLPETCDGSVGSATCASEQGVDWTGTLNCYAPGTINECTFNTAGCIAPCDLTSASWNITTALEGQSVQLNLTGTNCDGKTINFTIWEKDGALNPSEGIKTGPVNITSFSETNYFGLWTAEWQDDTDGLQSDPPEYYFKASVSGTTESKESSNTGVDDPLLLNVTKSLTPAECTILGINLCSDYSESTRCNADSCKVGEASAPSGITCGNGYNCECSWDNAKTPKCNAYWEAISSVCGNEKKESGEECDDGNLINGDGCNSTCKHECGISSPCPEGTTLCSDGTCSISCDFCGEGDTCNYNFICDTGEGCSCSDCNNKVDTCDTGLICNIFDGACCNAISDGVCHLYCSYIDPDCRPSSCGNGIEETGEECDDGNTVGGDGCSSTCTYECDISPPCPKGTALCSDLITCSLNCNFCDEGGTCDYDFICDTGEGCSCSDCNNKVDTCDTGLICNIFNGACCNTISDKMCNPYCSYVDPDCLSVPPGTLIGKCSYSEQGTDTCEDDGMLTQSLLATWNWAVGNRFDTNLGDDYIFDSLDGKYHYDPIVRKSGKCTNVEDTIVCPAQVEIPFFGVGNLIIAVIVIILIYLIVHFSNKKKKIAKKRRISRKKRKR